MTPRQSQVLNFVRSYITERGYSPSCQEVADAVGLKAKSRVKYILDALVDQGELVRFNYRNRGLKIPPKFCHRCGASL